MSLPAIDWITLLPFLSVSGLALAILGAGLFLDDDEVLGWGALVGLGVTAVATAVLIGQRGSAFNGTFVLDGYALFFDLLLLAVGMLVVLMSMSYVEETGIGAGEYYALVLFALAGMIVMASATDLIVIFLGLEVMSISVYILAGAWRTQVRSNEASMKYFLLGAFATGFLLYGIALVYGATGATRIDLVADKISAVPDHRLLLAGVAMLLVAFGFKVAAVPFHMWAPDVYDGAPTPIAGFMATGVKTAAFAALVRVLLEAFPTASALWQPIIAGLALATIILGNTVALAQQSIKRMLAYSSIAHAGYVLVAVWAGTTLGAGAVSFYLLAYSVTTLASFGILASIEHVGSRTVLVDDLEGLYSVRPGAALALSICLLSLLGFPGTLGFIGKWYLIAAAVAERQYILPVVMVLGSLVSAGYYLPVIMAMTMKPTRSLEAHRQVRFSWAARAAVAVAVAMIIVFGVWPTGPLATALKSAETLGQGPPAVLTGKR